MIKKILIINIFTFIFQHSYASEVYPIYGIKYTVDQSSFLKSSNKSYDANNLFPLNFEKAWCEGVKDYGIGEWLKLKLNEEMGEIEEIVLKILPGYAKSEALFYANSRPKIINLIVKNNNQILHQSEQDLVDAPLTQSINIPISLNKTKNIELLVEIKDIYKGLKYHDTCITELYVYLNKKEKNLSDIEQYLEDEAYINSEQNYIKNNLEIAKRGGLQEIVGLLRLVHGLYYKTAEGNEWLSEIYLDLLKNNTDDFLTMLAKQDETIHDQIIDCILNPVNDNYSRKTNLEIIKKSINNKNNSSLINEFSKKILKELKGVGDI